MQSFFRVFRYNWFVIATDSAEFDALFTRMYGRFRMRDAASVDLSFALWTQASATIRSAGSRAR